MGNGSHKESALCTLAGGFLRAPVLFWLGREDMALGTAPLGAELPQGARGVMYSQMEPDAE